VTYGFEVEGLRLSGHLARPAGAPPSGLPAVVIAPGYPSGPDLGATAATTHPDLAERIANEMGWVALSINFRGTDGSQGDFSLTGWLTDLLAAVDHLLGAERVNGVWLAGFGTGGALSICAGARDLRVRGVAALASPADFDDWARHPRRLLLHSRSVGIIKSSGFPASFDEWSNGLRLLRAQVAVADLAPRALLVMHGSDDAVVPVQDARTLAEAHGTADLRIIRGAGHNLRQDPRAMATLLGWLDRQRRRVPF
jgi:dipeptidyl aminopeptidase/acylaminoacyl peptidase